MNELSSPATLAQLLEDIDDAYDESELRTLCFELDIDFDNLPVSQNSKRAKARELIAFCRRTDRLPDLLATLQNQRPKVDWQRYQVLEHDSTFDDTVGSRQKLPALWLLLGAIAILLLTIALIFVLGTGPEDGAPGVNPASSSDLIQENNSTDTPPSRAVTPTAVAGSVEFGSASPTAHEAVLSGPATPSPTPTSLPPLSALNVTNSPGRSFHPEAIIDEADMLHLAWFDNSLRQSLDVLYRQRSASGVWSEVETLTDSFDTVGQTSLDLLQHPDGSICSFWDGSTRNAPSGFYMRCRASDGTWAGPELVEAGHDIGYSPAFSPDGTVYAIRWNGGVFAGDNRLSDRFQGGVDQQFAIGPDGTQHAVWLRMGDPYTVEYRFSDDDGRSWSDPQSLAGDEVPAGSPIELAADPSGDLHLVWFSDATYYRRWQAASGWSKAVEILPPGIRPCGRVALAVDSSGAAHVALHGFKGMLYSYQDDNENWSWPQSLVPDSCATESPALAVDSRGNRHFIWSIQDDDAMDLYYGMLPAGE